MKKRFIFTITALLTFSSNLTAEFNFSKIPNRLSAYYSSPFQPIETLKNKLSSNGFEILATTKIIAEEEIITITNSELKATNTYMATLQLLVNNLKNEIRVQNPSYFGAAYLQENYRYGQFKTTLNALQKTLGTMQEVEEKISFKALPSYNFMFGMPKFQDSISIIYGNKLNSKLIKNPSIAYSLKLSNGATLVGHILQKKTNTFLEKIRQTQNAQLLPYESIIQNNEVTIMNPKFYLALSLPFLSMSEFMKIATTPNQIVKDIKRVYQ